MSKMLKNVFCSLRSVSQDFSIPLDLDFIRSQFSVFNNLETSRFAMFENAGGSYVPTQVTDRLLHFFEYAKVQPYGLYPASVEAGEGMDEGYDVVAGLLNCDPDEVTLSPSTTINTYVISHAFRNSLRPGDEIIVTNQDHEANIGAWRGLSEFGAVVKEWKIDSETGELSTDDLESILSERTRLLCFPLCSNIVGTMNDVEKISSVARRHSEEIFIVGDGVSFAPHQIALDVHQSGLDLYMFSTYKTFGTHLGAMWINPTFRESEVLEPQGHYFNAGMPHYEFNPSGPLHAEIAAVAGFGDYIETIYDHHFIDRDGEVDFHTKAADLFELFADHETAMANRILSAIKTIPGYRIIGQEKAETGKRAATISFTVDGMKSEEIVKHVLEKKDVAIRNGHFYAVRCLEALGIEDVKDGVVRISVVHYNTEEEVERLVEGLKEL